MTAESEPAADVDRLLLPGIDTDTANPARVYDYLLGGKDNYAPDRVLGTQIETLYPSIRRLVRENRAFLARAVRYASEEGIGQFLDLGAGLPTAPSVHESAHQVIPDARVVYVDHDPVVISHARALLGHQYTAAVLADIREPAALLADPELRGMIDLSRPVAVLLVAVLHFVRDEEDPAEIVAELVDALAPGSLLVLSHGTADLVSEGADVASELYDQTASAPLVLRSREQIARFLAGLELVGPGVVPLPHWRQDGISYAGPDDISAYAAVARKPQPPGRSAGHRSSRAASLPAAGSSRTPAASIASPALA